MAQRFMLHVARYFFIRLGWQHMEILSIAYAKENFMMHSQSCPIHS